MSQTHNKMPDARNSKTGRRTVAGAHTERVDVHVVPQRGHVRAAERDALHRVVRGTVACRGAHRERVEHVRERREDAKAYVGQRLREEGRARAPPHARLQDDVERDELPDDVRRDVTLAACA